MNKKELITKIESLRKDIDYWKAKVKELEIKLKAMEDYKRGVSDTLYLLGRKQ
jgi:hypothetical protein